MKYVLIPAHLVTDTTISSRAVRLYLVLAAHTDDDGVAVVSRKRLAAELGASVDTVDRTLKALVSNGAIEIERGFDGDRQTTNRYMLRG